MSVNNKDDGSPTQDELNTNNANDNNNKKDVETNNDNDNNNSEDIMINTEVHTQLWKPAHCDVEYLQQCKGEMISIIGKLVGDSGSNVAVFIACDGKLFKVHYSPHKNVKFTKYSYNQIRGIVQKDLSIVYSSHYHIGDSFCLWTWNKVIKLMRKHPEIFD